MLHELSNTPRDYAWGSTTLLAALEGRSATGAPEAEVWYGDHGGDPADLGDGRTLDALTGGTLPYLLKLLAADAPLSIQVHPTRAQAQEGYAREDALAADDPARNYRDDNHKPELIVALSDRFEALCGLRDPEATRRIVAGLGSSAGVERLRTLLDGADDPLRAVLRWTLAEATPEEIDDVISAVAEGAASTGDGTLGLVARIAERNPGDPGVVVALLMNRVVLSRGEAVFLRAGLLHAYVGGLGVEIMAASDNVLRGGLTPKHIDVAELLAVVDTVAGDVPVIREERDAVVQEYPVPVPDFALRRVRLAGEIDLEVRGPAIVLATAGSVSVSGRDAVPHRVRVGAAVYATPDEGRILLTGEGEAFVAEPGSPRG
ncbi:mannose-6-phosphate isomerase [Microbacterium resistens]|uniref:mannose-6-phosphate isomerase n=1 Tax=Microbacterium resistens TaxID=156977 RepID=A0ABU1S9Q5_9MICO|nr:mannose-6-phosphate isomerase, class I [Microbacterium resistens]MDR6866342.1 mannose-6-phosphate isomerase [Microbacterium resistens]